MKTICVGVDKLNSLTSFEGYGQKDIAIPYLEEVGVFANVTMKNLQFSVVGTFLVDFFPGALFCFLSQLLLICSLFYVIFFYVLL